MSSLTFIKTKIFKLGDSEWIAAATIEEAFDFAVSNDLAEDINVAEAIQEGWIREISEEDLDSFKHLGLDGERANWPKDKIPSFREELAEDLASGKKVPYHFASTEC